ncbi:MAG: endolytic transglycosylase MltG [Spirochaetes bacterium]|nr:endolytic transglycosylase MltG [Spirochaetota bacterium]
MKKVKKIIRFFIIIFAVILIAVLAAASGMVYLNSPADRNQADRNQVFIIDHGENLSNIARSLKTREFIRAAFFLKLLSKFNNTEKEYKAGYYKIKPGSTTIDIMELLTSGRQEQVKVTFPEGWTIKKIALHLQGKGIIKAADFIAAAHSKKILKEFNIPSDTAEGYLYPDTYFFPKEFSAQVVVEIMIKQFFKVLEKIEPQYKKMSNVDLHNKIILASIVEREYRIESEAPLIASVFYNRLRRNIGLESCATLEYIITEIEGKKHPKYITLADKKIKSLFNTYMWAGLPPAPISNPGVVAIDAAFHPAKTDYWYFVLKNVKTGEHYFSRSLKEHNKAKHIYLKKVYAGS